MPTPRFEHGWRWSLVQHATARPRKRPSKSVEEDADETRDEEGEYQEEEDAIPNFEIDGDNGDIGGLDSEYEYENDNEMTEDEVLQTADT